MIDHSAQQSKLSWRESNRPHPCLSCGRSGYCQFAVDDDGKTLVMCRRVAQPGSITRTDKNGVEYHLWSPDGRMRRVAFTPPAKEPERADAGALNAVYHLFLRRLQLQQRHRDNLRQRGLSDEAINYNGYRSAPGRERVGIAGDLAELYGSGLFRVPGFFLHQKSPASSWPSIAGRSGILIPVRDLDGRIVALLLRHDEPGDGPRYTYLSSKRHGGPGPGAPCHAPLRTPAVANVVRITEGVLKADVAAELSGLPTLGVPGVANWRTCLPLILRLRATTILLAFDMDWQSNDQVRRPLVEAARLFLRCGFKTSVETWDATHKGIDDALAVGLTPTRHQLEGGRP